MTIRLLQGYIPQILLSCTWHPEQKQSRLLQTLGNPARGRHNGCFKKASLRFQVKLYQNTMTGALMNMQKEASYIKMPEGQNRDDHGGGGPAFSVGAVKNEGRAGVISQGALHGIQQLIEILRTRTHTLEIKHKNKHTGCTTTRLNLTSMYVYHKEINQ